MPPIHSHSFLHRRAFTLIELMIAVGIIGLVATTATVNLIKGKQAARDGTRKEVAQTYQKALTAYQLAKGTTFISDGACNYPNVSNTDPNNPPYPNIDPTIPLTGAGCVGANGRSYGKLNFTGTYTNASPTTPTSTLTSVTNAKDRNYNVGNNGKSIADALKDLGYLSVVSKDPQAHTPELSTDPDFVLVRGCGDGRENIGINCQNFAIWVHLEGDISSSDLNSTNLTLGGSAAATQALKTFDDGTHTYQYDYASGNQVPTYVDGSSSTNPKPLNFALGSVVVNQ